MKELKLINQLIVIFIAAMTMNIFLTSPADALEKQKDAIPKTTKAAGPGEGSSNNNSEINRENFTLAISNAAIEKRFIAIKRITNQFLLAYIAKDKVDPRIAHAALGRITLPSLLKDIAGTAAYASVKKVADARRSEQWRKDLELKGSWICGSPGSYATNNQCRVSILNKNPELTYVDIHWQPSHLFLIGGDGMTLSGRADPASSNVLYEYSYSSCPSCYKSAPLLLSANPVLFTPNEHEQVIARWKALKPATQQLGNVTPEISEIADIHSTVQSDVFAKITGVTTTIKITASDPNFDNLTYSWSASNGTIRQNKSSAVIWDRPVDRSGPGNGSLQSGSITVVVSNSRGEKAEKTFRPD
jgi:hypothetical protein